VFPIQKQDTEDAGDKKPPMPSTTDEWTDVVSKRGKKGHTSDGRGKGANLPTSAAPWRSQKGEDKFAALRGEGGREDRFAALRSEPKPEATPQSRRSNADRTVPSAESTPESRRNKDTNTTRTAAGEKSNRFSTQDSQTPKSRPAIAKSRNEEATPDGKKKDDAKLKVKHEILTEVDACLEDSGLHRSDFDMRSRQYLHAIYEKGGRDKVHAALQVITASTRQKSRDSVQNWPAYVLTLLRYYFNDLKENMVEASETVKNASAAGSLTTPTKLAPSGSSPTALSEFAPALR
jgi:hypothetical protein